MEESKQKAEKEGKRLQNYLRNLAAIYFRVDEGWPWELLPET